MKLDKLGKSTLFQRAMVGTRRFCTYVLEFYLLTLSVLLADVDSIARSIVHHTATTLARTPYNMDDFGAYQATAHS